MLPLYARWYVHADALLPQSRFCAGQLSVIDSAFPHPVTCTS